MKDKYNPNIHCDVVQCRHNASDGIHCSLESITVGTHEANPSESKCTDCMSFDLRSVSYTHLTLPTILLV